MDWKDIGNSIASVAPTIAGVLANVAAPGTGVLAAAGVKALLGALGLGIDAAPADVSMQLQAADPEMLLKLKQADQQFQKDMKALDIDLDRIYAGDRDSARKMAIETRDRTPFIFGTVLTIIMGVLLAALMFLIVPAENQSVFYVIIGTLTGVFGQFATFLYGANKDTKMTTQLLAAAQPPTATQAGWKINRGDNG